ncbi:MAG: 50S ribosomal protein L20 [Minisyncoccia bacterium]
MTRVKKGVNALKTRRNILAKVKGYRFGRSKKERQANEAIVHAGAYAFAHRRDKKGDFRRLWNVRLSAVLRENGFSYSKFIPLLKKNKITLDRKVLAEIAQKNPEVFKNLLAGLK